MVEDAVKAKPDDLAAIETAVWLLVSILVPRISRRLGIVFVQMES